MPQLIMMIAPAVQENINEELLGSLGKALIADVEEVFGIKGKHDVAFTVLNLAYVIDEADIQVEVRYTAGKDEYDRGEPFDPSEAKKQELVSVIGETLRRILNGIVKSASIWPIPVKDSEFSMIDVFPEGYEDIASAPEDQEISVMWGAADKRPEFGSAVRMGSEWFIRSDPNPHANGRKCGHPRAWYPKDK